MCPFNAGTFLNLLLQIPHSTGFPDSVTLPVLDEPVVLSCDFCLCNPVGPFATLPTGPFGGLCTAARAFAATKAADDEEGSVICKELNVSDCVPFFG